MLSEIDNVTAGVYTAGPREGGGWRIFDVWQDEASFQRFEQDRLGPAVMEVTQGQAVQNPPRREIYELHGFITA